MKIMRFLAVSAFTFSAFTVADDIESLKNTLCGKRYEHAEMVMSARQNGIPMPTMIVSAMTPETENVVKAAYGKPLYRTDEAKKTAIVEFANSVYLDCMNSFH